MDFQKRLQGEIGVPFVARVCLSAVVSRSQFVQNDPAVLVYTVFIDRCGDDSSNYHQASIEPLLCPFDLAFEMALVLGDARRSYYL